MLNHGLDNTKLLNEMEIAMIRDQTSRNPYHIETPQEEQSWNKILNGDANPIAQVFEQEQGDTEGWTFAEFADPRGVCFSVSCLFVTVWKMFDIP